MYRRLGGDDGVYADAPSVSADYDAAGFRNPASLDDWEIAVVGDSFTELGFLPYDELFTTLLGHELGVRVKNLGVSYTGPASQTYYLHEWGKAASTTDVVLVFFEGNDFSDLASEQRSVDVARASGAPSTPPWDVRTLVQALPKQTSFVTAVHRWLTGALPVIAGAVPPGGRRPGDTNAVFIAEGTRTAVTLERQMPPPSAGLRPVDRTLLDDALWSYDDTARRLGLRPWLAFMPCKRRVLEGALAWNVGASILPFPAGIAELVERTATSHGVRFVDLTPALRRETAAGRLTYNTVWDTHLNRLGAETVAGVLASALARRGE
jgi:hypothetical protein